jgi:hypothetical protein
LVIAVAIALVACGGGDEPTVTVNAATYSTVLAAQLPPPTPDEEPLPVVFVVSIGDEPLSLEDQIEIVARHAETHDIRFVDDLAAAVDVEVDQRPVRDGGVVVGLGTIPAEGPYVVRVETYRTHEDVTAQLVTVTPGAGSWRVVDSEAVDPEVFVGST